MRTFIAIDLPDEIKVQLVHVIQKLRRSNAHATWVQPDNLHLTMKFLGEVDEGLLPQITQRLDDMAHREQPFSVTLNGFGFLPPGGKPRVLYATTDQQQRLTRLANNLERHLQLLGFQPERHFTSHITLARIKSDKNLEQLKKLISSPELDIVFVVTGLNLYRSTLHPDGPRHNLLHRGCFRGSPSSGC